MTDLFMKSGAEISPCRCYRYLLWRRWDVTKPRLVFVMLNPSTADGEADDPTIRKCMGFARRLGFGGIRVLNLYALRSTFPSQLWKAEDPVGPENDSYLERLTGAPGLGEMTIAAWGAHARPDRVRRVLGIVCGDMGHAVHVLRLTAKTQAPEHPLYLPGDLAPMLWMDRQRFYVARP